MKELIMLNEEEVLNLCRSEKVDEKSIYLWYELSSNAIGLDILMGEWIWSNDVKKVVLCYNKIILKRFLMELVSNNLEQKEYYVAELLDIYEAINGSNECIQSLRKLTNNSKVSNYYELTEYIKTTTSLIQNLGVECDSFICDSFDDVIPLVEIHNEGIIPVYDTKEEYLINDYYG